MNGLLILDKPKGFTSHDVVARVRQICSERSIGHLGTLDPMATGVLPLALGNHTRLAQFYGDTRKSYDGTIQFGYSTDTYDADGEPTPNSEDRVDPEKLTIETIREAASTFVGTLKQVPPPFSAKKIGGVPAYKLARKKQDVKLEAVEINVAKFEILSYEDGIASFSADVSSGTYIRSLAHLLGIHCNSGAHLASLRRTRVGEFDISEAVSFQRLESSAKAGEAEALLIHPRRVLSGIPAVTANEEQIAYIRNGRAVNLLELSTSEFVRVFANQSDLVAICRRVAGTLFQPKVVLAK